MVKGGAYGFASATGYGEDLDAIARVVQTASRNAAFLDSRVQRGKPDFPANAPLSRKDGLEQDVPVEQGYLLGIVDEIDAYIAELNRAIPAMRLLPANAPVGGVTVRDTGEDTSAHRYLTFNNYIYLPTGDPQANALAVVNRQARAAMVPG